MKRPNRRLATLAGVVASLAILGLASAASAQEEAEKPPRAPEVDTEGMVEHSGETFSMGVPYQEIGPYGDAWFVDQQPANEVRLDGFYLDEHEVTVREFALFLTYAAGAAHYNADQPIDRVDGGYLPSTGAGSEPIREVTWWAARDYCRWAGKRLPTEAEWEFAAAGSDGREYPWGDESPTCDRANHFTGRTFCKPGPQPVGEYPSGTTPNEVHDLAGNVAEWTADWYDRYPDADQVRENPTGPEDGTYKVVRGGGFLDSGKFLRTRARRATPPGGHARDVGFRCAMDLDAPETGDEVIRGDLQLPEDRNREESNRFPAPAAPTGEILARDLGETGEVVAHEGRIYIVDREAGALVEFDPDSGTTKRILENRPGLFGIAAGTDRLWATDQTNGEVLEIVPGMATRSIASTETEPGPITARGDEVVWGEKGRLVYYDDAAETTRVLTEDVTGVTAVALSDSKAFYSTDGDGDLGKFELADIPLAGGTKTVYLQADDVGSALYAPGIDVDHSSGQLYYVLQRDGFPRHGFLCRNPVGSPGSRNCLTNTPPRPGAIDVDSGTVYWASQHDLVSFRPGMDRTFSFPAKLTRISDLHATAEYVYWGDPHTGRLYRVGR